MPKKHSHKHRKINGGFWPFDSKSSTSENKQNSWFSGDLFGTSLTGTTSSTGSTTASTGTTASTEPSYTASTGTTTTSTGTTASTEPSYTGSTTPSYNTDSTGSTYGGKSRKHKRRHMRGGYKDNISTTNLAAKAASFSGPTAKPHTWVGGRTRRHRKARKHHHTKSCKHRR